MSDPVPAPKLATHPKGQELLKKLDDLEKALLAQDPKMPGHLKEIHKYLIGFEELAHLLSEDQIAKIVQGQQIVVGEKLAEETKSGKGPGNRKGKNGESISESL